MSESPADETGERDAPEDPEAGRSALPEFTKKVLSLGLGAYFLTEEKVLSAVRDARLPKDFGSSLTSNASRAKEELLGFISREVARAFKAIDVQKELEKALARHKVKISAEIEFLPLDGEDSVLTPDKVKVETVLDPRDGLAAVDPKAAAEPRDGAAESGEPPADAAGGAKGPAAAEPERESPAE